MIPDDIRCRSGAPKLFSELENTLFAEKGVLLDPDFSLLEDSGNPGRVVVAISSDQLGFGEKEHGEELLLIFLKVLCERVTLPDEIVFYHRGVLALGAEHPVHKVLLSMCSQGIEIKACRESLDFYKKEPAVQRIQPVPMSEITRDLLKADKVIHP